jgi:hypothetical protein
MGILDDAIREHLDLKRRHGARDAELREIEDEALGSSEDQPDPFAASELFNEVSSGTAEAEPSAGPPQGIGDLDEIAEPSAGGEEPTRLVEPEGLRPTAEPPSEPLSPPEGIEQLPGQTELPEPGEIPGQERLDEPFEGYQPPAEPPEPAAESPEPPEPAPPSESLEDLIAEEEPFPEDTAAPAPEPPGTEEEELPFDPEAPPPPAEPEARAEPEPAEEPPEPPSSVPEPPPPPPDTGPEPPGRARGRVDVPTQEHPPPGQTGGLPAIPEREPEDEPLDDAPLADAPIEDEPAAESGSPQLYDFETDEDPVAPARDETDDDFEALGPAEEEAPYLEEEEPYAEEPVSETEAPPFEEPGTAVRPALEDEEAYEGGAADPEEGYEEEGEEGLWFEKGPPKDFDFDE